MNDLTLFHNFQDAQIVTICLLFLFVILLEVLKKFIINSINYIDLTISVLILVLSMFLPNPNTAFIILLIIVSILTVLYTCFDLFVKVYLHICLKEKTAEYVKNSEYDYFVQMDKKERITDCSSSLLKLTKLSKKEILKSQGWKFILDNLNVKTINKEEFSLNYVANFLSEFKECNSKHKTYRFTIDAEMITDKEKGTNEYVSFIGIIQPVYCKDYLIARNIFFYQDRVRVVEQLKTTVRKVCTDLEDAYLQLDMMMSMSEGIVMYYDYQNKVYVATDCMRLYTKTEQKEYTFESLFSHIHPDDVEGYLQQAETVNSLAITKIRYRLQIGGVYYSVEEDSIYLRKEYGLISIIRIAEKGVVQNAPRNAKIQNDVEELNKLFSQNIKEKLNKTIDILNSVLGKRDDIN